MLLFVLYHMTRLLSPCTFQLLCQTDFIVLHFVTTVKIDTICEVPGNKNHIMIYFTFQLPSEILYISTFVIDLNILIHLMFAALIDGGIPTAARVI